MSEVETFAGERFGVVQAIVVEGRDDTIAVNRAVDAITIETHGFGIRKETWELLKHAYETTGIIIFTDPDYSGEQIRKKLLERFPDASQAFLSRDDASRKGDVGIENAEPEAIREALEKACCTHTDREDVFSEEDIFAAGLTGREDSKLRRDRLGKLLGIGYANSKVLLKKLNKFGITREAFENAVKEL